MGSFCLHFLWLLCASSALADVVPLSSINLDSTLSVIQNRFIVELASSNADSEDGRILEKRQPHELLYASLAERNVPFQVDREYDTASVFVGAAITLNSPEDVKAITESSGVIAVRPTRSLQAVRPVSAQVIGEADKTAPLDRESTHVMTGVDKLHSEGVTGKGIKIGIIDTGIDYTHPLLGGGFGPRFKVIGGYDFVGNAYNGTNTPKPGPNPLDQCNGHGTHVAGIIGANPQNNRNISGVAYDAHLSAYRVFGCSGSVSDDVIVDALLLGLKEGNAILTLSLGGPGGWTESTSSIVASRIAALGKVVTVAAGNDGSFGAWYTSNPGNGIHVMSVASVENTAISVQQAIVAGVQHNPIVYSSLSPLPVRGALPIYATSNDTTITNDACNPLPSSTPDLSAYLVIIRRGTCTFVQKLANIAAKGGKVALIYDNGNGFSYISAGNYTAAMIQAADGEFLVSQFAAGAHATITFPQTGASTSFPNPNAGLVSSFSSYGPSEDFYFKPAVAAPGGSVLSTWPVPLGSFSVLSGTSMATPFVAGSAALLLQVKGQHAAVAHSARSLFETTAKLVPSSKTSGDPLQTAAQQGAGLIQVHNAIRYATSVTPGELVLNDTAHFQGNHTLTITNNGRTAKTYKLTHTPAGTALTVRQNSIETSPGPVPLSTRYAHVTFSTTNFILNAGSTVKIEATITPPTGVDSTLFPVYSGFIEIDSGTERLHVTYLGLAASLKNKQVVDDTSTFFGFGLPAVSKPNGQVQSGPTNYTFIHGNVPKLLFRLVFGTPLLRIDLVKHDIALNVTLNGHALEAKVSDQTYSSSQGSAQVPILGKIAEFDYVTRNTENLQNNGYSVFALKAPKFANGTAIHKGSYRLLLRALRVTGNRQNEADYETWLSPIIGFDLS
ncbi:hypothetical protein APHAL10511_003805 [Amanita phalloides]|nr:hypothetical protein APHAL10511_003805 [Amanita phalloides]